jgi:aspartate aminotransferase
MGGVPVEVKASIDQDFKVTANQLKPALNAKTKMVIFSSPCNPSGSVYHKDELEAIADVLKDYPNVTIVSDEIYEYINFLDHHTSIGSIASVKERTVTVNGFSKGFAMTGWRLGFIGAPEWLAKACTKIQGQFTSGASSFGQKAAAYALNTSLEPTHLMREAFLRRRDMFIEMLSKIEGFQVNQPQGAFYVFPNVEYYFGKQYQGTIINNADDFAMFILEKAHVALVSGAAFGDEKCVRLSYAASEKELTTAVERIKDTVALLN